MKILIVEDEVKVGNFLKKGLEEHNYETDLAFDGHMGKLKAIQNSYDLIILDVILPYMNGFELCKTIRESNQGVPILMLSALGTTENKVSGFDAGADDYLAKPFEFTELLARIRALTKRGSVQMQATKILKAGDLELNLEKKSASRGGKIIVLTAKEFSLLEFLMRNRNIVMSRAEIAERVWDITFDTGTNVVDVYINILRRKIDKDFETKLIHTRIGMGYLIRDE